MKLSFWRTTSMDLVSVRKRSRRISDVTERRWQETKNLSDRPRSGAPRATNAEQHQKIVDMALADMDSTSKTIQLELQDSGVNVTDRTIRARLKDAGLKYSKPLSKPLLTDQQHQQRLL